MPKGNKNSKKRPPAFAATLAVMAGAAVLDVKGCIGWDADATQFTDLVKQAKEAGCTDLTVRINSMGGYCYDGLAMGDCLKTCGMRTKGVVIGTAQSMASYLLQCCDVRAAHEHATLMFHQPSAGAYGTVDEIAEQSRHLLAMRDTMFATMGARCGMSGEELSKEHMVMKIYTAQEALAKGFLDEIEGAEEGEEKPEPLPDAELAAAKSGLLPYNSQLLQFAMQGEEEEAVDDDDDDDDDDDGEDDADKKPAPKEEGGEDDKKDGEDDDKKPTPPPPAPKKDDDKKDGEGGKPAENRGVTREEVAQMIADASKDAAAKARAEVFASMGMPPDAVPGVPTDGTPGNPAEPTLAELDAMPPMMRLEVLNGNPALAAKYLRRN